MDFKGVILDLDNTLYAYTPCHEAALEAAGGILAKELAVSLELVRQSYAEARREVHAALKGTASSHNRLLYFQKMLEGRNVNRYDLALKAYRLYWDVFIETIQLNKGVLEFLRWVKGQGCSTAILTDLTADVQCEKMIRLGLVEYIDVLVTSEETGCDKPNAKMFQVCLSKLGLSAKDVCMVGDDLGKDIYGALNQNIKGFWITEHLSSVTNVSDAQSFPTFHDFYEFIRK